MSGRHLRNNWADLRTLVHVAWLERRDRNVWTFAWIIPLTVAVLRPH